MTTTFRCTRPQTTQCMKKGCIAKPSNGEALLRMHTWSTKTVAEVSEHRDPFVVMDIESFCMAGWPSLYLLWVPTLVRGGQGQATSSQTATFCRKWRWWSKQPPDILQSFTFESLPLPSARSRNWTEKLASSSLKDGVYTSVGISWTWDTRARRAA